MDNRAGLLAAALHLFAARGYDAVGVQEIADAAGIGKPTLYHYFGSKRGLLDAVLDTGFERLTAFVAPAAVYQPRNLKMSLEATARAYFDAARADPTFYRLQLALWFAPSGNEAHQAVAVREEIDHRRIEGLFARAADDYGNMRGRHQAFAATFLGTINTYVGMWLNGYVELDDALVRDAVHQFMHGILS